VTVAEAPTTRLNADRQALLERVQAGEWLQIGDIAVLLDVSLKTVDRMLSTLPETPRHAERPPLIRHKVKPGGGGYRLCDPQDVLRELATPTPGRQLRSAS
jgi:hypothetical protein